MGDQTAGNRLVEARVFAPAKVNLGLRIVGRRPDGYHELESVFWPVGLCDQLFLSPADTPRVECAWAVDALRSAEALPQGRDNLAMRAMESSDITLNIRIIKTIPTGGGLGGGSSDAGAVLRYARKTSVETATALGADVPFFLDPRPAWVSGIGERVERLPIDPELLRMRFLLVIPPFSTPTAAVFREMRRRSQPFSPRGGGPRASGHGTVGWTEMEAYLKEAKNDLEAPARDLFPELSRVLDAMRETDFLWSGLSGSGSTCCAVLGPGQRDPTQDLHEFFRSNGCRSITLGTFQEDPAATTEPLEKGEQHGNHGSEGIPSQRGPA